MGQGDIAGMDAPVRDTNFLNINEVKERQIVTSLSRNDLEDRYLRLRESQNELKKKNHSQEEKMKQMATKLLRLVKDRKKLEEDGGVGIESKQNVDELQATITSLERQNNQLKSKLLVFKQQLQTQGVKNTPYDHVKSRINTGISPKKATTRQQRIKEQLRVQGSPPPPARPSSRTPMPVLPQPRYGHSLLEESRLENRDLEDAIGNYEEQIKQYEEQVALLRMQIKQKDIDHDEDMQKLRMRISDSQQSKLQENIELVKLQREVKDKVAQLQRLQGKYKNVEELLSKVKLSHEQVLEEMEGLTAKLKQEKEKSSRLENEIKQGNTSNQIGAEKDEIISDMKAEIELLKEAHEKLLHSTFDAERERKYRAKEREYQIRISQLEATIKADVSDKNVVLDKLTSERDLADASRSDLRELQVKHYEMKEKYDDLTEKLKFFTAESSADFEEIQEALLLIKTRKEKASHDLNFLEKVDESLNNDMSRRMQELQAAHAETINELEKTRNMLIIQHNINRDYQKEVEVTTRRMEEVRIESETRSKEYAELLDMRAARIKKLEAQLRDVAYGTKQFQIKNVELDVDEESVLDFELERGQNVFEIHVGKLYITNEHGKEAFGNTVPSAFISFEFFEHELQATAIAQGMSPDFQHTSQYTVQVDDFFLHYLQKEAMTFELHQAFGTEYKTIAKGAIRFNDILDRSQGRVHFSVSLTGVENKKEIAVLEYWIRLRVPMEQALRLYKERTKALGYLTSNELQKLENPKGNSFKNSGINELRIGIVQCLNLKSKAKDVQPSSYCVYKFFDFADHDTEIVESSNSPQFHDFRNFPVPMTEELDLYLKNLNLTIYVFDDLDPEPTSYIGIATVPLISLSQDKQLNGKFQLKSKEGIETGAIDVQLKWQYTYLPASAKIVKGPPQESVKTSNTDLGTSSRSKDIMQPIVSSGKLLTPHIPPQNEVELEVEAEAEAELLEPIYVKKEEILAKKHEGLKEDDDKMEREYSASSLVSDAASTSSTKDRKKKKLKKKKKKEEDGNEQKEQNVVKSVEEELEISKKASKDKKVAPRVSPPQPEIDDSALKDMDMDELAMLVEGKEPPPPKSPDKQSLNEGSWNESDRSFLEEELRRTVETPELPSNDTMFVEEEFESELSDDNVTYPPQRMRTAQKNQHEIGESSVASTETEDDVIVSSMNRSGPLHAMTSCTITVTISSLTIFDDAPVLTMHNIKQMFVSYKFLDCDPEELETPVSLPKPKANRPISFNFKKVFHVDAEQHGNARQHLMHLLMPEHPNEGRIFFTVVSDPVDEDDEDDCDDVGIAYVDLIQILRDGKDLIDTDIDVYDLLGSDGALIGALTVSVEAVDALRSLYNDE